VAAAAALARAGDADGPAEVRLDGRRVRGGGLGGGVEQRVGEGGARDAGAVGAEGPDVGAAGGVGGLRRGGDGVGYRDGQVEDRVVVGAVEPVRLVDADVVAAARVAG